MVNSNQTLHSRRTPFRASYGESSFQFFEIQWQRYIQNTLYQPFLLWALLLNLTHLFTIRSFPGREVLTFFWWSPLNSTNSIIDESETGCGYLYIVAIMRVQVPTGIGYLVGVWIPLHRACWLQRPKQPICTSSWNIHITMYSHIEWNHME